MKSIVVASMAFILAALAPAAVQAETPLQAWKKSVEKIAPDVFVPWEDKVAKAKGLCVCRAEYEAGKPILFDQPGVLLSSADSLNGGDGGYTRYVNVGCYVPLFVHETGALASVVACSVWLPLTK